MRDMRAPKIVRVSTSLPRVSVPRICVALPSAYQIGGVLGTRKSPMSGSWGAIRGAKMAQTTRTTIIRAGITGHSRINR